MTFREYWQPLTALYDAGEARSIALLALERRFGLSQTDVLCGAMDSLDEQSLTLLRSRLLAGEPVQYVLGEAEFCGRIFHVEPGVLIPRKETEWLCHKAVELMDGISDGSLLDIGTGSGCIACTVALERGRQPELLNTEVVAWDISDQAIAMARGNAAKLGAHICVEKTDALNPPVDTNRWDIIISNPPYVCQSERVAMHQNVLCHEPELALFVPDDDPLLFYRAIARYAIHALKPCGKVLFEINPLFADEITKMAECMGFGTVAIENDIYGKKRYAVISCPNGK